MSRLDSWLKADGEVAVLGLGASGVAVTTLLATRGVRVYASDANEQPTAAAAELQTLDPALVSVEFGGHDNARVSAALTVITSPGIPPGAPPLLAARNANVEVLAEAEVGLSLLTEAHYVAITGTNGKSTTTAMIEQVMRTAGRSAVAAGNIGLPVSTICLEQTPPDWLALELSSFQLHDMPSVDPDVTVLTNIVPDHLDRYANFAEYRDDKALVFRNAGPQSVIVSNLDDPVSRALIADVPGRHLSFSISANADAWYDASARQLMLGKQPLMARDELPLLGDHNVANALAAALAVHATGVQANAIRDGLKAFAALPHRMELVGELNGVTFINDSKATNIASTQVALAAMDQPFVLLLGGRHKGESYTLLADQLAADCVAVVTFGESASQVVTELGGVLTVESVTNLADAVERARELVEPGGAVLLSPACSSYDMFDNYQQRGESFRSLVMAS
jgi:UDP-N-acetylmuramoylalanine--D-glutamate ligase